MYEKVVAQKVDLETAWRVFFTPPKQGAISASGRRSLADAEDQMIDAGGFTIALSTWGDGPPVLLMHGWDGNRTQLRGMVGPLLEAGYRVIAFDLPAHGDSPGKMTNIIQGRAVTLALGERFGPFHAVLAHSFGTLIDTMALSCGLGTRRVVHFGAFHSAEKAIERFFKMVPAQGGVQEAFKERIIAEFGAELFEQSNAPLLAAGFDLPALFFHDKGDDVTPYSDSVAITAAWPDAQFVTTEGLGHRGAQRNADVIRQVLAFIQ